MAIIDFLLKTNFPMHSGDWQTVVKGFNLCQMYTNTNKSTFVWFKNNKLA